MECIMISIYYDKADVMEQLIQAGATFNRTLNEYDWGDIILAGLAPLENPLPEKQPAAKWINDVIEVLLKVDLLKDNPKEAALLFAYLHHSSNALKKLIKLGFGSNSSTVNRISQILRPLPH